MKIRINGVERSVSLSEYKEMSAKAERIRFHKSLPAELNEAVHAIRKTFRVARPLSYKQWADGFCMDLNPHQEVAIWISMAAAYLTYFERHKETKALGRKVLSVLVACTSTNNPLELFGDLKEQGHTAEFISEVSECYFTRPDCGIPTE